MLAITPLQHYQEAERLEAQAVDWENHSMNSYKVEALLKRAHVHAMLAVAGMSVPNSRHWLHDELWPDG